MLTNNRRLIIITTSALLLLMVPFVAMQFTQEVNWTPGDFLVMGGLLLGAALAVEFVLRKIQTVRHRIILCAIILATFLLVWADLAVGIFGTPLSGS